MSAERLAIDANLQDDTSQTVAARRDGLHGQIEDFDRPPDGFGDCREGGSDWPVASSRRVTLAEPGTREPHVRARGLRAARHAQVGEVVNLRRAMKPVV